MRLLIIDDEIVALNALKKRVDWLSYGFQEVFTAQDAASARELLVRTKIDLVLCDVEMPGEDGLSLIRFIRDNYVDTDCIMVTCHAEFDYLKQAMKSKAYDYILKPIDYEELDTLLKQYAAEKQEKNTKKMVEQIVERTEAFRGGAEDTQGDRIETAKRYIEDHLHEKIYVEDLASLIHVNEQYFMRVFKKETGKSVTEYITERRISLASALLKNTDKSINFIADSVGCDNYSYFTKLFKKYTGFTPREYRNQFQKS